MNVTSQYGFLFSGSPCNSGRKREEEPVLAFKGIIVF
jgi:hypothetical protein